MNMQELKSLIYQGEKVDVECKKAQGKVPDSVYETYSSFANTKGGMIVLGVLEDKTKVIPEERFIIQGVDNHEKLREDFWNTINSQWVSANFLRFFLQTLILRGLQHFFFLIIITFSWFDTILTPIFYFWCQLIATLSSLVISLSILDISLTWLYTSIVTSMWACPIIY